MLYSFLLPNSIPNYWYKPSPNEPYAKQKKPDLKSHILNDAIYMAFLKQKLEGLGVRSVVANSWGQKRGWLQRGYTDYETDYENHFVSWLWWWTQKIYSCLTIHRPAHPWKDYFTVRFSWVAQSCPTLCNPMNRSTPGLPVHHQLLEFTQTRVHRVDAAIQPSHPLSSPSPPAPNPSQHQGLFQWVNSSHEVAKVLQFQL